jgi:tetratricopeptide (TPR) repeat protein
MQSAALFLLRYVLIAAAIGAAFYSSLLARAAYLFGLDTANSVPAAVRLVPYNAAYVARLASWEPEERQILLRRAVELNPFDYESLIQLGLLAEMQQGDPRGAEAYYVKAAEVDHMFLPRWTLTNFYFRQQNASEFFRWAKETLKITQYSSDPIFTQMWLMSQDANRLGAVIPDRPRALIQYAWFLSNSRQFGAIPQTIQRLVAAVGNDDPRAWGRDDLIASMEDRMLAEGDTRSALQVWTSLKDGGWIRQSVPDEKHPLTNDSFRLPFLRHGFDWLTPENAGVKIEQFPEEEAKPAANARPGDKSVSGDKGVVRISLSGEQPEHCILLQQYVPLEPGADYLLGWQAQTRDLGAESGLAWHVRLMPGKPAADLVSNDLFAAPASWKFHAPASAQSFVLSLEYTRPLGRVRSNGAAILNSLALNRQP